ncbi:hypothetical protein TURU_113713 [Turdus rufiventris]|nr:hypothetical protein TURU_113713 [Turdus rufiventris]
MSRELQPPRANPEMRAMTMQRQPQATSSHRQSGAALSHPELRQSRTMPNRGSPELSRTVAAPSRPEPWHPRANPEMRATEAPSHPEPPRAVAAPNRCEPRQPLITPSHGSPKLSQTTAALSRGHPEPHLASRHREWAGVPGPAYGEGAWGCL